MSKWGVAHFEKKHGILLPEDFRRYITTVRNGVPGFVRGFRLQDCLAPEEAAIPDFLATRFPQTEEWESDDCNGADYLSPRRVAGSILLTDEGEGNYLRLVVSGPAAGQVWGDSRRCEEGLFPACDRDGKPLTFLEWCPPFYWTLKPKGWF